MDTTTHMDSGGTYSGSGMRNGRELGSAGANFHDTRSRLITHSHSTTRWGRTTYARSDVREDLGLGKSLGDLWATDASSAG